MKKLIELYETNLKIASDHLLDLESARQIMIENHIHNGICFIAKKIEGDYSQLRKVILQLPICDLSAVCWPTPFHAHVKDDLIKALDVRLSFIKRMNENPELVRAIIAYSKALEFEKLEGFYAYLFERKLLHGFCWFLPNNESYIRSRIPCGSDEFMFPTPFQEYENGLDAMKQTLRQRLNFLIQIALEDEK